MGRSSRIGDGSQTKPHGRHESIVSEHTTQREQGRTRSSSAPQEEPWTIRVRSSRCAYIKGAFWDSHRFTVFAMQGCGLLEGRRPLNRRHRSTCQTTVASSLKWKMNRPTSTTIWVYWRNFSRKESAKKDILTNYLKTRDLLTQKIHSASTSLMSQLTQ